MGGPGMSSRLYGWSGGIPSCSGRSVCASCCWRCPPRASVRPILNYLTNSLKVPKHFAKNVLSYPTWSQPSCQDPKQESSDLAWCPPLVPVTIFPTISFSCSVLSFLMLMGWGCRRARAASVIAFALAWVTYGVGRWSVTMVRKMKGGQQPGAWRFRNISHRSRLQQVFSDGGGTCWWRRRCFHWADAGWRQTFWCAKAKVISKSPLWSLFC